MRAYSTVVDSMPGTFDRSLEQGLLDRLVRRLPPDRQAPARRRLRRIARPALLGTLRWSAPVSRRFGYDRGTPVDRYYIDRFLDANRASIRGRVLEVKDSGYTDRFGTGVTEREVLDADASNALATIVDDLATCETIPDNSFDCFILTQTLQYVAELEEAVANSHRILKPAGTLLATVPTLGQIVEKGPHLVDYWRFTRASCEALVGEVFGPASITVETYGSCLTSVALLVGMACEELTTRQLERHDPAFALLVSVRATKA
jgi:SAM-dependent methyltransferase